MIREITALAWVTFWKFLDAVSTDYLLSNGVGRELNPVYHFLTPVLGSELVLYGSVLYILVVSVLLFYIGEVFIIELLMLLLPLVVAGNLFWSGLHFVSAALVLVFLGWRVFCLHRRGVGLGGYDGFLFFENLVSVFNGGENLVYG